MQRHCPVVLVILDGWGWREEAADNAIRQADTLTFDYLWKICPHALLRASGTDVGLPEGHWRSASLSLFGLRTSYPLKTEFVCAWLFVRSPPKNILASVRTNCACTTLTYMLFAIHWGPGRSISRTKRSNGRVAVRS
jgi:Metalloenzyme superfamily